MNHPFDEPFEGEESVPSGIDRSGMPLLPSLSARRLYVELLKATRTMPPENDLPKESDDTFIDRTPLNEDVLMRMVRDPSYVPPLYTNDTRLEDGTVIITSPPCYPQTLPEDIIINDIAQAS